MLRRFLVALIATIGIGISTLTGATPAQANGSCSDGYLCFYSCYLSESCGHWFAGVATQWGCSRTYAGGSTNLIYSVKNRTGRNYHVYHTTNCTGTYSTLWAMTNGNMNNEWAGAGIQSFARIP